MCQKGNPTETPHRPAPVRRAICLSDEQAEAITDLHEALQRLEQLDPRQSQMLEHRYFGGLSLEETAEVTGVSLATVKRELRFARAWLAAEPAGPPEPPYGSLRGGGSRTASGAGASRGAARVTAASLAVPILFGAGRGENG